MPWPKKQSVAILMKAKRSGDKSLERKAKDSLARKSGARIVRSAPYKGGKH